MKKRKIVLYSILTTLLGFALIVFAGYLFLISARGNEFIKGIIIGQYENYSDGIVGIEKINTDLFSYINLEGIVLYPREGSSSDPILTANKVNISYNLPEIIFNEISLDTLICDSITVNIFRDYSGKSNLPFINQYEDKNSSSDLSFSLKHAEINNTSLNYNDEFIPLDLMFNNFNFRIDQNVENKDYYYDLILGSAKIVYNDNPVYCETFKLNGKISDNLQSSASKISVKLSSLFIDGNINHTNESFNSDLKVTGYLDPLVDMIGDSSIAKLFADNIDAYVELGGSNILSDPTLSWELIIPEYSIADVYVKDFNFAGNALSDSVNILNLSFNTLDGNISVLGWIIINDDLTNELVISGEHILVSKFLEDVSHFKLSDNNVYLNLKFNSNGNLLPLHASEISSQLELISNTQKIVSSEINVSDGNILISSHQSSVDIYGDLSFKENLINGIIDINIPSLNPLVSTLGYNDIDGELTISSDIIWNKDVFTSNSIIESESMSYNEVNIIDSLVSSLSILNEKIEIDSSFISGRISDVSSLSSIMDSINISSGANYEIIANGPISKPNANINIKLLSPSFNEVHFSEAIVIADIYENNSMEMNFNIMNDSMIVNGYGDFDLSSSLGNMELILSDQLANTKDTISIHLLYKDMQNYSGQVIASNFNVSTFNKFLPGLNIPNGDLTWTTKFELNEEKFSLTTPFEISDLGTSDYLIENISGSINLNNDILELDSIQILHNNRESILNADITLNLNDESSLFDHNSKTKGLFVGDSFNLMALNSLVDSSLNFGGIMEMDLEWDGTLYNPNLNGEINIYDLSIQGADRDSIISDLNGNIVFENSLPGTDDIIGMLGESSFNIIVNTARQDSNSISTNINMLIEDEGKLQIDGTIVADSLDLVIKTDSINLDLIAPLFLDLENIGAELESELNISGDFIDPNISGEIMFKELSYDPNILNLKIDQGYLAASLDNDKIIIDSSSIELTEGKMNLNGNIEFDEFDINIINLALTGSDFDLVEENEFLISIDTTEISITKFKDGYKISGNIELGNTEFNYGVEDANLLKVLSDNLKDVINRPKPDIVGGRPLDLLDLIGYNSLIENSIPDYMKNYEYEIAINNSDSIWINNNIAKARHSADLSLNGTILNPLISGTIGLEDEGKLYLLDREFDIRKSTIEFSDKYRINPILDISAESEITEVVDIEYDPEVYLVNIEITGPLDNFQLDLISSPELENSDIISLISLGITYKNLLAKEGKNSFVGDFSQVILTRSISNQIDKYYNKWFGDYLGFDRVGIRGNIFDSENSRFEVSKTWGDNIEVIYSTSINDINTQTLKTKYKISKYFFLEGISDQQEQSSADLKFQLKFK